MCNSRIRKVSRKLLVVLLLAVFAVSGAWTVELPQTYAASAPVTTAIAKVTPKKGAYIRKSMSTSSKKVVRLKKNAKVKVLKEIFATKKNTSAKKRWYYVSYGDKKGYLRADQLGKFSYSTVKGVITTKVNYRAGAGPKMKKKGSFKKNTNVSVYLEGSPKGSKIIWYKVKVGKKLYYVHSGFVKITVKSSAKKTTTTTKTTTAKTSTAKTAAKTVTSAAPAVKTVATTAVAAPAPVKPEFTVADVTYPTVHGESLPFNLKGTIKSNVTMTKGIFSVVNSSGKTVLSAEKVIDSTTFNISSVDKAIKFGSLAPGTYTYRGDIYIGTKCYNQFKYKFTVKRLVWGDKIARTAIALCHPLGTEKEAYTYGDGDATAAFKAAMDEVYPDRSTWGSAPKVGASCDVFVGTAARYSGYDVKMPRGLGDNTFGQWFHLDDSDKWQVVPYSYKESELRNGDIIIYKRYSGSQHVCVYVKINGEGYLAEAALKTYYGHLSKVTSGSKIFKGSDKEVLKVYRATDIPDQPISTNDLIIKPLVQLITQ